jgi:hypothetical protein
MQVSQLKDTVTTGKSAKRTQGLGACPQRKASKFHYKDTYQYEALSHRDHSPIGESLSHLNDVVGT